eukprot:3936065-Rhodomonas_salina.1
MVYPCRRLKAAGRQSRVPGYPGTLVAFPTVHSVRFTIGSRVCENFSDTNTPDRSFTTSQRVFPMRLRRKLEYPGRA